MRKIMIDAEKTDELWHQLSNVDAEDELRIYLDENRKNDDSIFVGQKFPDHAADKAVDEISAYEIILHAFSDDFIIEEARYVLSNYYEEGHVNNEMLSGEDGPEEKKRAQREVRQLKRFLKKYDKN